MRAIKGGLRGLRTQLKENASAERMLAAGGKGENGTRFTPPKTGKHDENIGVRIDRGKSFTHDGQEWQNFKLQINKQAANPTLRNLAKADSHKVWAEADMAVSKKEDPKQAVDDFFDRMEASLDARSSASPEPETSKEAKDTKSQSPTKSKKR